MALSDILRPTLVELGTIRIGTLGEARKGYGDKEFRLPKKLDHFLITTKFRDKTGMLIQDDRLMQSLKQEYADPDGELREIPISVLSDDIEDFLRCSWTHYRGKRCFARGDGKTVTWFYDRKTEEPLDEPQVFEWKPEYKEFRYEIERNGKRVDNGPLFKKQTVMDVVIAHKEARWGGVYRVRTTSVISGDRLYGSLLHIKGITGGVLRGMPLRLCVRPANVFPDNKPTTVYVLSVDLLGDDLTSLQNRALELARFQRDNQQQLLTVRRELLKLQRNPEDEDTYTQADIQREFYPDYSEGDLPSDDTAEPPQKRTRKSALDDALRDDDEGETQPSEGGDPELEQAAKDRNGGQSPDTSRMDPFSRFLSEVEAAQGDPIKLGEALTKAENDCPANVIEQCRRIANEARKKP